MIVQNLALQVPYTTKDGSTIRSILDRTNAPVRNQSLAEACVGAGVSAQRHYHRVAEEVCFNDRNSLLPRFRSSRARYRRGAR